MRQFFFASILIIWASQSFAQDEMEASCIKAIREYSTDLYFPKFTGSVFVSKDTIKYDNSCIIVRDNRTELVKIFELGLVFPDLIFGAGTSGEKFEFRKTYSSDTLIISKISELHFPNQEADTKIFSFLLWYKTMANPHLYIFQLANKSANSKTPNNSFIDKAKVTAFGFCSILI